MSADDKFELVWGIVVLGIFAIMWYIDKRDRANDQRLKDEEEAKKKEGLKEENSQEDDDSEYPNRI